MTQPVTPTATTSFLARRPSESPAMWFLLLAGSIAIHGIILLIVYPLTNQLTSASEESAAVPVELVEVPPDSQPSPTPSPELKPEPTPISPAPVTPTPVPPDTGIAVAPSVVPQATPTPSLSPSPTPSLSPSPTPSLSPSPTPSLSPSPTPSLSPSPTPSLSPSPLEPQPEQSGEGLQPSETPPPANPELSENPDLPGGETSVSRTPSPARFSASLSVKPIPAAEARDIPEIPASPRQTQQIFTSNVESGCIIVPDINHYLGQPVTLRVTVEATGKITEQPLIQQSSGNEAYDNLAACLVRQWEFTPASDRGNPRADNVDVEVVMMGVPE